MVISKIQLEDDEQILASVRKHWFIIIVQMLGIVAVALFPLIGWFIFTMLPIADTLLGGVNNGVLTALYTCWLILCWMALFNIWTNYYLDVWTITTKRLIAIDQRGLFYRNTGSFRLERLQDINISIRGIIGTFLDYGDILAQTASEDVEFVARSVPHPQELKALIMKASDSITFTQTGNKTNRATL